MRKFTLFYRGFDTPMTKYLHVEGVDLGAVQDAFDAEYESADLIGALEGHVVPLWWEEE